MAETSRQHVATTSDQSGFSILELLIVLAILFIIAAMMAPNMLRTIDNEKLRGAAQSYAYLIELARTRAVDDNWPYEIQNTTTGGAPVVYVDINDDGSFDSDANGNPEPNIELSNKITLTDTGAPAGFDTSTILGVIPLYAGSYLGSTTHQSPMVTYQNGTARPGLAFNERGLPCQRVAALANCTNSSTLNGNPNLTAWVTFLKYQNYNGTTNWAAVTVTPAGRIKSWFYQNGTWQ